MRRSTKNIFKYTFLLVAVLFLLLIFVSGQSSPDNLLRVYFFDIGQGDATLVRTPYNQDILIDAAPSNLIVSKLGSALPLSDRDLELVLISHPHLDHFAGLLGVLERYKIKKMIYGGEAKGAHPDFQRLLKELEKLSVPVEQLVEPRTLNLGEGLAMQIYSAGSDLPAEEKGNNASLLVRLVYQENEFLFTGDLEQAGEEYFLQKGVLLEADVLKVGHHGSATSTSQSWLKAINPEIAVISVGKDNDYGHPSLRVLKRLARAKAKIYRTDQDGDVAMQSDGLKIKVKAKNF